MGADMIWWKLAPYGAALVVAFGVWKMIEARGAEKAIAKVERNNAVVTNKAKDAGRKSADPNARGVLNPNYRTD